MIKNILVPVDFSSNAKQALDFAIELAKPLEANVEVVHYFLPKGSTAKDMPPLNIDRLLLKKAEELENFVQPESSNDSIEVAVETALMVKTKVKAGFASTQIVEDSRSGEYDMIIMGSTGSGGVFKQLFGSVSLDVVHQASCPVLLIPPTFFLTSIEKIAFATNHQSIQPESLKFVQSLSQHLSADVNYVHITSEEKNPEVLFEEFILEKLLIKNSTDKNLHLETVKSDIIWKGLNDYCFRNKVDLLTMVPQQRSFFNSLFKQSQTKKILAHIPIPTLIIHAQ